MSPFRICIAYFSRICFIVTKAISFAGSLLLLAGLCRRVNAGRWGRRL